MNYAVLLVVLVQQPDRSRFQFVTSDSASIERFFVQIADCRAETRTFANLLAEIADSSPLPAMVGVELPSIKYGKSYDETRLPLYSVDLADIEPLPALAGYRRASTDSTPLPTRCGTLARTLGEAIAYRRMWQFWRSGDLPFADRLEIAREYGLGRERYVARDQQQRRRRPLP
jgi:hypothetical protein